MDLLQETPTVGSLSVEPSMILTVWHQALVSLRAFCFFPFLTAPIGAAWMAGLASVTPARM